MKILQIHNYYQLPGGEDTVVKNEYELLTKNGIKVIQYLRDNKDINDFSFLKKNALFVDSIYNKQSYKEISALINLEKPDICHVHNTLTLISPSVYYACKDNKIPIVQTLHNYRLICSNAYFFRNSRICEECLNKSLYNSVKYGCYRNSKLQTFILTNIIEYHRLKNTWNDLIDAYIALTGFAKNKFIIGGLPKDKIIVKPNFNFNEYKPNFKISDNFLFIGRLDAIKGIDLLLNIGDNLLKAQILIAGSGERENDVKKIYVNNYLGQLNHIELINRLKNCNALIFPSICYETFGLVAIEAFSVGKPVIASKLGAMAEIIEDGKTGLLFEPNNIDDLKSKLYWAINNKAKMVEMGKNAYKVYLEKYTPEKNFEMLMDVYNFVLNKKKLCN